jgi:diguanylate cyclase
MPLTDKVGAMSKLERIREYISQHPFCEAQKISLTISAGIAQYNDESDLKDFIQKADKNLYKAKNEGRNRVIA